MLGRRGDWQKIEGRILASEHTGWGAWHGVGGQKKYVVEYSVRGTTKRVELKRVMGLNSFKMISPKEGSSVPLLFDQRSGKVEFDTDDPRLAFNSGEFAKEDGKSARDAYRSALKGRPGRAITPAGDETGGGHRSDQPDPQLRRARVALREARRNRDPAEVERLTAELERLEHDHTHARSQARSAPEAESIEQRLARLQQLRDHGVITPEEFTTQRERILDSL